MSFYSKAIATGKSIAGKGNKTVDPQYVEAEKAFQKISVNVDEVVGTMAKMEAQFENLSKLVGNFGNDVETWYKDSSDDTQLLKSQVISSFSHNFSMATFNYLNPRIEFNVINKLASYKNEVFRLKKVQENVKQTHKQYDQTLTYLNTLLSERDENMQKKKSLLDHINPISLIKPSPEKLDMEIFEVQKKLSADLSEYEKYNTDFITSVQKLVDSHDSEFTSSFKSYICIMSKYMFKIFEDMQKFKTAFPIECFMPKTTGQQKSFIEQIKRENSAENDVNNDNNNNNNNNNNNDNNNNNNNDNNNDNNNNNNDNNANNEDSK